MALCDKCGSLDHWSCYEDMTDFVTEETTNPTAQVPAHLTLEHPLTGQGEIVTFVATPEQQQIQKLGEEVFKLQKENARLRDEIGKLHNAMMRARDTLIGV